MQTPKSEVGMKFDTDKPRWDLLPLQPIALLVSILTFGAKKYAPNNWQLVEKDRYEAAMWRHWYAHKTGEWVDSESGYPHLAHMFCNVMFYLWKCLQEKGELSGS